VEVLGEAHDELLIGHLRTDEQDGDGVALGELGGCETAVAGQHHQPAGRSTDDEQRLQDAVLLDRLDKVVEPVDVRARVLGVRGQLADRDRKDGRLAALRLR
jgi:hypothetical protein